VPNHGPPGTNVAIFGDCFRSRHWNHGYGIFLLRQFTEPRECEVIAGKDVMFSVDRDGRGTGEMTVPARGHCFQRNYSRRLTPGWYHVGAGCHACYAGRFRVTARAD